MTRPPPTRVTLGPYHLLRSLGAEDGGQLFTARHRTMGRLVSVWLAGPGATARQAAATRAAALAHPHVLTVLDVGRGYVVTEYVAGAGLDAVGQLPADRAADLIRQVVLAVAHAHGKGLTHGNLHAAAVRVGRPGGEGPDGLMLVKVGGFRAAPACPQGVAADLLALGTLAIRLLADTPDVSPAVADVVAGLLDPDRQLPAADAADRLLPADDLSKACPFAGLGADRSSRRPASRRWW